LILQLAYSDIKISQACGHGNGHGNRLLYVIEMGLLTRNMLQHNAVSIMKGLVELNYISDPKVLIC